ncbi:FAD-binding oxidoreductase [Variovorax terrae]|uniref:FAD-binding oxidoreductase n=1 Tax=Variovorax terrae TaxID=2923278 RepID=A0A9X2AMV1_9BURK|nr:FAD-binding oxidoreductase [Variovorax terrae]MCJ0761662.1 FAD-binding oxidoreductase [Variovorax terrae]
MNDRIESLKQALAGIEWHDDPGLLRSKSKDFHWYSPVLTELLQDKTADLLVQPRDMDELRRVAAACARLRLPVTLRGGGTGNYGQCVPMERGVIIETLRLDAVQVRPGSATVQTGCIIERLEQAARATGQEILMFPSTLTDATIGGFISGGFGGVGSIRHGVLKDPGNVTRIQVMTLEEAPRLIELRDAEIQKVHHAFGTNGIITEMDVKLAPAEDWRHVIALFDDYEAALRFGQAAMRPDLPLRLLTSVERSFAPYYTQYGEYFPESHDAIFAMVAAAGLPAFEALVAQHGGRLSLAMTDAEIAAAQLLPAYECAYNHTTLMALKKDKAWTYMQLAFPQPFSVAQAMALVHEFGHEIYWHHEFSLAYGEYGVFAIPLVSYFDAERLAEIKQLIEAQGVGVFDAHVITIEDGGMKTIDTAQIDFKKIADPHGLMNPGKTRGWLPEYARP